MGAEPSRESQRWPGYKHGRPADPQEVWSKLLEKSLPGNKFYWQTAAFFYEIQSVASVTVTQSVSRNIRIMWSGGFTAGEDRLDRRDRLDQAAASSGGPVCDDLCAGVKKEGCVWERENLKSV